MIAGIRQAMSVLKKNTDLLTGAVMDDPVIHARTKGVGVLSKQIYWITRGGSDARAPD
jgi:NADH:ubiquinone oxidoreductase subunit D